MILKSQMKTDNIILTLWVIFLSNNQFPKISSFYVRILHPAIHNSGASYYWLINFSFYRCTSLQSWRQCLVCLLQCLSL